MRVFVSAATARSVAPAQVLETKFVGKFSLTVDSLPCSEFGQSDSAARLFLHVTERESEEIKLELRRFAPRFLHRVPRSWPTYLPLIGENAGNGGGTAGGESNRRKTLSFSVRHEVCCFNPEGRRGEGNNPWLSPAKVSRVEPETRFSHV